jgi:hypothetical protein
MLDRSKLFRIWQWLSAISTALWAAYVLTHLNPALPRMILFGSTVVFHTGGFLLLSLFVVCIPPISLLMACYASLWIWERFGAANWLRLPANVRRGVLRLYLTVAIPWILWFAYRISDDAEHFSRHRYLERDFLALLTVPLGSDARLRRHGVGCAEGHVQKKPTVSKLWASVRPEGIWT